MRNSMWVNALVGLTLSAAGLLIGPASNTASAASESRLSDEPIEVVAVPDRPKPLIEFGDPFLGDGNISEGFELPTGAIWRPSFIAFGTVRSALQTFDPGDNTPAAFRQTEWANRVDLFGNLQLSPTERFLISIRPTDKNAKFSGYRFKPSGQSGFVNATNLDVETLFFEGEIAEIFPNLDPDDTERLDYGFSIGRQPLIYQDGIVFNDSVDAIGIVRNNVFLSGTTQGRITGIISWGQVHRGNGVNRLDRNANLYGLVAEFDTVPSTINLEAFYVASKAKTDSNGFVLSASAQQQHGRLSTTMHIAHSQFEGPTRDIAGDGTLLFAEASYQPIGTINNLYATGFWGHDHFRSAARAPGTGGPLGRAGILFAGVGLGRGFLAALPNQVDTAYGGSIGYQMFFQAKRRQLIVEIGGRNETSGPESTAYAVGGRFQQALGQRWRIQATGFIGERNSTGFMNGGSLELLYQL